MRSFLLSLLVLAFLAPAQDKPKPSPPRPDGIYATFDTSEGTFKAYLYEKDTPNSVRAFIGAAQGTIATLDPETKKMLRKRRYDGITFHRVVRDEMIQSGDPTGTGSFPCGFTIQDEILPGLRFTSSGRLAMANAGPNTGGCQFFITVNPMSAWNGNYTIFGHIVEGMDVVEAINRKPVKGDRPVTPVQLHRVSISRVGPPPVIKKKK